MKKFILLNFFNKEKKSITIEGLLGFKYSSKNFDFNFSKISHEDLMFILKVEKKITDVFENFELKKIKNLAEKIHFFYLNNIKADDSVRVALNLKFLIKKRQVVLNNIFPREFSKLIEFSSGKSSKLYSVVIVGGINGFSISTKLARVKFAKLENVNKKFDKIFLSDIFTNPIRNFIRSYIGSLEIMNDTPALRTINSLVN